MNLHPARKQGESFKAYRARRKEENEMVDEYLRTGRYVHRHVVTDAGKFIARTFMSTGKQLLQQMRRARGKKSA